MRAADAGARPVRCWLAFPVTQAGGLRLRAGALRPTALGPPKRCGGLRGPERAARSTVVRPRCPVRF